MNFKTPKGRFFLFLFLFSTVVVLTFIFRVIALNKIPVFADEAIYIRWAQVMKAEPTLRFLPLSDGKQPLFMWTMIPFFKVFKDPLIAGRLTSVMTGSLSLIGVGVLSFLLFRSKKASIFTSILYALSPFTFFFDRMALVDSMLSMFGVWFLVFLVIAVKKMRWDFAMMAGFALGGALLTKSPGLFFLILMPASIFLTNFPEKGKVMHMLKICGLWVTAAVIGFGMAQILRLGPNYHMIASRNLDYVYPVGHIIQNAKDPFIFNLDRALEWLFLLGPVWLATLALLGVAKLFKFNKGELLFLLAFFVGPFLVGSMYAKVFTARYVLYTIPPLFVLAGVTSLYVKKLKWVSLALFSLFLAHSLWVNGLLVSDPVSAPIPESERSGYFEEWSSGFGIKETADIVLERHRLHPDEQIVIGTEGYFGTLPDGLQIYLEKVPNVTVIGTGLDFKVLPDSLIDARKAGNTVYFAVNSSRLTKEFKTTGLTLLYSVKKALRMPGSHDFVASGPQETYFLFQLD